MAKPLHYFFLGALVLGTVACSSDSDSASDTTTAAETTVEATDTTEAASDTTEAAPATDAPTTTEAPTTTAAPEPLRIMVTNDDGYQGVGLDVVIEALKVAFPDAQIDLMAPAEDKTGTGDSTTPGALTASDVTTASGHAGKAVAGFPADTVIYAVEQGGLPERPHLVVSGINKGQNVGPAMPLSGTIGAARTAAKFGIPAVAGSQQAYSLGETPGIVEPAYEVTAAAIVAWIEQNYDNLLAGTMPALVYNINGATCVTGTDRGVVAVPPATDAAGRDYLAQADCVTEPAGPPTDDMDALVKGYTAYSEVDPVTLAPV